MAWNWLWTATIGLLSILILAHAGEAALQSKEQCEPKVLTSDVRYAMDSKYSASLDLFSCAGIQMAPRHLFADVHLSINLSDPNLYRLYQGPNCTVVQAEFASENRLFGLLRSVSLWRSLQLDPFTYTVIGVETTEAYAISLIFNPISVWRLALFVGAILLYIFAPWLVRNAIVYYASGCTTGVLLSALLIVFMLYRVAPKKTIGLPILVGGWSVATWMAYHGWQNLSSIVMQYQNYVAAYFVTMAVISFAYCYQRGPPTDVRSLDVATWFFQLIACCLIYFSSQVPYISYATIALLLASSLALSSTSQRLFAQIVSVWRYFFPQPRRLLTQEEYEQEGSEYTRQELAKLRDYCRSPGANQWKIASKLQTPTRLARFVEGDDDHVNLDEERDYMDYTIEGERFLEAEEADAVEPEDERSLREEAARLERERQRRRKARLSAPLLQPHRRRSGPFDGSPPRSSSSLATRASVTLAANSPRRPAHHSSSSSSASSSSTSRSITSSTTHPSTRHSTTSRTPAPSRQDTVLRGSSKSTRTGTSAPASAAKHPRHPSFDREYYSSDEDDTTQ